MAKWEKKVYKLEANHKWKAPPGYNIFVANWGALQFNVPQDWIVLPDSNSIKLHDRQPPDDNCRLEVSVMHLPPIDLSDLPIGYMLAEALADDDRTGATRGEIVHGTRPGFEFVWTETRFLEGDPPREARTRTCLARGANSQPLITMDFWLDDAEWVVPVWDELLRSLHVGEPALRPGR